MNGTKALDVACNECLAVIGQPCTDWQRVAMSPHVSRVRLAAMLTRNANLERRSRGRK